MVDSCWKLAERLKITLQQTIPGSVAEYRGSLATGKADIYSDIDLLWELPDEEFGTTIPRLMTILNEVQPVESLRFDPEFQNSMKRRLIFVRFSEVPLFWRLDLEIFAKSIQRNPDYDATNPTAQSWENWSWAESALNNVIAAAKNIKRGRVEEARQLILRAYQRVEVSQPEEQLNKLMLNLIEQIKAKDSNQAVFANRVWELVLKELDNS